MKNFVKRTLFGFYRVVSAVRRRLSSRKTTNTVVIIKQDGIGDFVLFLPIAEELRKFYNGKKIVFCCAPHSKELAESCGFFDQVIAFSPSDFEPRRMAKTFGMFSRIKCDILLHPTQPRTVEAEQVARWIPALQKIASLGEAGALSERTKRRFDKTYDRLIDTGKTNMTLIQSANFVRELGDSDFRVPMPKIQNVQHYPIALPDNYFVLFLGGSIFNKMWHPERYCEVVKHIVGKTGWTCLICGTEREADQTEVFDANGVQYCSLLGKTTITELLYVISRAKFVIGNDTCAIHMANATGVPSLCVKGQFSGEKFFPYKIEKPSDDDIYPVAVCADVKCKWCTLRNGGYFCLHGDYFAHKKTNCISRVSVDDVISAVDSTLEQYYDI